MFGRRERNEPLATLPDAVEIIAIVAAGLWALYVFAYEQRLKPASEPPSLRLTGSLHKLGTHNGLIQLAIKATISNNGSTVASRTLVYRTVELTRLASPKYSSSFTLQPGQELPYSAIFAIKAGEFDAVALYGSIAYRSETSSAHFR